MSPTGTNVAQNAAQPPIRLKMCTQSVRRRDHFAAPWVFLVAVVVLIEGVVGSFDAKDYCQAGYCDNRLQHVTCSGYKFGAACNRPILLKMTPKYVNLILNFHNSKRNALACGSMRRFGSASSMQKMRWSDELAYLAEYNAKSCDFAHDECHNTAKFRYTGQNIAMKWFHGMNLTATRAVKDMIRKWYLEHKMAKQRDLDNYVFGPLSPKIGHFTQMLHADTTEVGCALVRFYKKQNNLQLTYYYLVCNYSEGNLEERPVYRKGTRCSKCKYGCTKGKYRCLCR